MAYRQLDKIQHGPIIDLNDIIFRLNQLASFIERILKIIMLFRHACIGDGDINVAGFPECVLEVLPGCYVAFDKGCAGGYAVFRGFEVKNESFGALGHENLDYCQADA